MADEKRFGIWHSGLTGRYYAGWAKRRKGTTPEQDLWEATGVKHDVTADVLAIVRRGLARWGREPMTDQPRTPTGTDQCPLCGATEPHEHTSLERAAERARRVRTEEDRSQPERNLGAG